MGEGGEVGGKEWEEGGGGREGMGGNGRRGGGGREGMGGGREGNRRGDGKR